MILLRSSLLLFLGLFSAAAMAQEVDTRHYIYIEATGSVSAPSDHALVGVSIVETAPTPQEVVDASIKSTNDLLDILVAIGIPQSDIQTSNFVFEPAYIRSADAPNYGPSDPDRDKFDGYRVRNSMRIDVKDLPKLGTVLAGVAGSASEISSVDFRSSKGPQYYERAREQAAANALNKAQLYAKAMGVALGQLLSLREGGGYNPETMEYDPVQGEGAADLAISQMPVAPGTLTFSSSVSTKWEVVPATGE